MSVQAAITLVILVATLLLMGTQRLRGELTALLVMLALILTNVLTAEEAFSAFGEPVIILIAALFIIGGALYETGAAAVIASQIMRLKRRGDLFLLLTIMVSAALLSAFISNLLVVAVFLPAVLRVARRARISPAQLLMPLNTAGEMGSFLLLIGAISTVVINDLLGSSGYEPLGLFALMPYGLVFLAITILWFALFGPRLLPTSIPSETERPSLGEVERTYKLEQQLYQVRVRAGSDLVGQRLNEVKLGPTFRLNVVAIQPDGADLRPARSNWVLEQDDILVLEGARGDVLQASSIHHLEPRGSIPLDRFEQLEKQTVRLAEVMIPFRSNLVGKTVSESRFRDQHGLNILAVQRDGKAIHGELSELRLAAGDAMLVQGPLQRLRDVGKDLNLILVTHLGPRRGDLISRKIWLTAAILAMMIVVVVFNLLSLATASLAAALALLATDCISVERAYQSIDASILLVVGGLLPLATALEKSGLAAIFASGIAGLEAGPFATLVLVYALSAVLTQVISNTVVGVLLLPVTINLAQTVGIPAHALAIAVMVGVTTSYVTPLTHGSNLMIVGPGGYSMRDFLVNHLPIFVLQSAALLAMLSFTYL